MYIEVELARTQSWLCNWAESENRLISFPLTFDINAAV